MSLSPLPPLSADSPTLSLLELEPDLASAIPARERAAALRATRLPEVVLEAGAFSLEAVLDRSEGGFGALIVSGLVARRVSVDGRGALRLLGPGDLFTHEALAAETLLTSESWSAPLTTHLAVLDEHLLLAVRRWPGLLRSLLSRMQQCHDTTLLQLSVSHRPAVEDRIVGLFALLAERWGRMTTEGIVVPMPLTHEAIGQMIGARRSTVTLGLRELSQQGRLRRLVAGEWLLGPHSGAAPPAPLRLQPVPVAIA